MSGRCGLTGGAGFIGTYLARVLSATGREVLVLDRRDPVLPVPGVSYLIGQHDDPEVFASALAGCSELVDLAYATQPKTSFDDPLFDLQGNVPAAVALFRQAAAQANLDRLVFVSSGGTVYGPAASWPIQENAANHPISPYGITKLTIENYALMYYRIQGLPVQIVRPSNAYGPGQMPFSGQGFVATAIGSILKGQPIPVFGGGVSIRDYLYVEDLARGILAVLDAGKIGEIYNLGSGCGHSNLEVLELLGSLAATRGYGMQLAHQPARGFDVPANVLDIGKVCGATGWRPQVPLAQGLAMTWDAIAAGLSRS